jgi:hypothetical protein
MSEPVVSQYRLLRTRGGVTHFARVAVAIERAEVGVVVEPGPGLAAPHAWVSAALRGAREAAEGLSAGEGLLVRVVLVEGTHVDTREDDVVCAAALAVWRALRPGDVVP